MASSALTPYNPRGLASTPLWRLHEEMDRLFDEAFRGFGGGMGLSSLSSGLTAMPHIDVQETDQELCISAELPGVKRDDIDVQLDGDVLTISGEKKSVREEKGDKGMHVSERSYGRFSRSMQLPFKPKSEADIKADFEDGVLTLRVPRQADTPQRRRIQIGQGHGGQSAQGTSKEAGGTAAKAGEAASH